MASCGEALGIFISHYTVVGPVIGCIKANQLLRQLEKDYLPLCCTVAETLEGDCYARLKHDICCARKAYLVSVLPGGHLLFKWMHKKDPSPLFRESVSKAAGFRARFFSNLPVGDLQERRALLLEIASSKTSISCQSNAKNSSAVLIPVNANCSR